MGGSGFGLIAKKANFFHRHTLIGSVRVRLTSVLTSQIRLASGVWRKFQLDLAGYQ